jgi:SAM-dependent methyltransferase
MGQATTPRRFPGITRFAARFDGAAVPGFIRPYVRDQRWLIKRLPEPLRARLTVPAIGLVRFGDFRRLEPIDDSFGWKRGQVIDRYYIEKFLEANASDIRGRVLEVGDASYTTRFGGANVEVSDVLHYLEGNPHATIVGDLADGRNIGSDLFDCIILTQTLQMIFDVHAAIRTLHRILKPGGVLLVTGHGTSKMARHHENDGWGEYWRFTRQSAQLLFGNVFGADNVEERAYGNVLSAVAFLQGIAAGELTREELDHADWRYEVVVAVRARKADAATQGGDGAVDR